MLRSTPEIRYRAKQLEAAMPVMKNLCACCLRVAAHDDDQDSFLEAAMVARWLRKMEKTYTGHKSEIFPEPKSVEVGGTTFIGSTLMDADLSAEVIHEAYTRVR